jgi:LacI family transcriptional regulator
MSIVKVANHAGVSTATVSRVLNNLPGVRAETALQVRRAMEALQYDPARLKRTRRNGATNGGRRRGATGSIAILTLGQRRDWLQLPVMASAVTGISRAAKDAGFKLLLDEMLDVSKPLSASLSREVDGMIVFLSSRVPSEATQAAVEEMGRSVPTVWVMGGGNGPCGVDHVAPDNHAVGQLAFEYLERHGCRDVAYFSSLPSWSVMRMRGQGFASAAHDAGARCSAFLLSSEVRDGEIYGRRTIVEPELNKLVERLAEERPRPTGIFISTDALTVQVHPMLRRHGLRAGEDLTIISCDNEQIRLSGLSPRPASIDTGAEDAGYRAVRRLMSRIANPGEPPVLIRVAPRLVEVDAAVDTAVNM